MNKVIRSVAIAFAFIGTGGGSAIAADRAVVSTVPRYAPVAAVITRAKRGNVAAETRLGWMYSKGQGVPQNYYEAASWFYRAAIRGDGGAQFALGMLYNKGQGVRRDYVLANMWLNLSTAQAVGEDHDFKAKMRDAITSKMTERQVGAAQELALDWYQSQ